MTAARPRSSAEKLAELQALKPGGLLLIRDHAVADLTQLRHAPGIGCVQLCLSLDRVPDQRVIATELGMCRLHGERLLAPNLYSREDGTTCYFYSVQELAERLKAASFLVLECEYACTLLRNRKRGLDMKRAFIHCIGQKL